nr:hypothetical protein [Bacilli bacterium]
MKRSKLFLALAAASLCLGACDSNVAISIPDDVNTSVLSGMSMKDVYQLYLDNGGTLTYEEWLSSIKGEKGDTGVSIVSVSKTSTEGLVDTYTIEFSDGSTSTFTITNGAQGEKGEDGTTPHIGE